MKRFLMLVWIPAAIFLLVLAGCRTDADRHPGETVEINSVSLSLFRPLPAVIPSEDNPLTDEKVALGRMLYYETRLSRNHDISCNSCHMLDKYGVDGQPTSPGHKGLRGDRNSPTVYNAAGHFVQFWDGRAGTVEEQAKGPVTNPVEMAMPSEERVVATLKSMPEYVEAFKKAFPGERDPVTFDNVGRAIGAFERRLVTPARWDKFLQGDHSALTGDEKKGFNHFVSAGCPACHAGVYVGGNLFHRLGAVKPWPDTTDTGRAKVTNQEADRMMFKVPGLRNIEKTGPYYHDGGIGTLEEAVSRMAEYQLGKTLAQEEVQSIVIWLKSLTGEIPGEYIKAPPLPKSTSRTPKPEKS